MPEASVDLVFVNAEPTGYPGWWPHPLQALRRGGLIVIDNVLSHAAEPALEGRAVGAAGGVRLAWSRC